MAVPRVPKTQLAASRPPKGRGVKGHLQKLQAHWLGDRRAGAGRWVPNSPQPRLRCPDFSGYSPGSGNPATGRRLGQSRGGWKQRESGSRHPAASLRRTHPAPPPKRRAQSVPAAPPVGGAWRRALEGGGALALRARTPLLCERKEGREWRRGELFRVSRAEERGGADSGGTPRLALRLEVTHPSQ